MRIESIITDNRTTYYSHGHSSNRLDHLMDKVTGIKRERYVNKAIQKTTRECEVCCEEFDSINRFCSKPCREQFRKLYRKWI